MTDQLDIPQLLALAAVLGFASGIRLYAVVLAVGLVGYTGWIDLPAGLQVLAHPWVLAASGFMFAVEFFADKVPALDSLWDAVHTFIRIPAGAAIAGAALGADSAAWAVVAAILGGSLAATSHFTKAGTRAAVNTSPEPFSNIATSTAEDLSVVGLLWLAFSYPVAAAGIVVLLALAAWWLLPKLFRLVRSIFTTLGAIVPTSTLPRPRGRE